MRLRYQEPPDHIGSLVRALVALAYAEHHLSVPTNASVEDIVRQLYTWAEEAKND